MSQQQSTSFSPAPYINNFLDSEVYLSIDVLFLIAWRTLCVCVCPMCLLLLFVFVFSVVCWDRDVTGMLMLIVFQVPNFL